MPTTRLSSIQGLDSLREKNFLKLWVSTIGLGGGFWLHQIIIGWLTFELTGSALLTSISIGLVEFPVLFGAPIGGILADRLNRKSFIAIVGIFQIFLTGSCGIIISITTPEIWLIYTYVILMGTTWSIVEPSRVALVGDVVPKHNLINAFALNMFAFHLTRFIIPGIGGVLMALWGAGPSLGIAVVFHGVVVVSMLTINSGVNKEEQGRSRFGIQEFLECFRYVGKHRIILSLIILSAVPPLMVLPFVQGLMPIYVSEIFQGNVTSLGAIHSSIGIGALLGSFVLACIKIQMVGRTLLVALGIVAILTGAFSRSESVSQAMVICIGYGSVLPMIFTLTNASIQSIVPEKLRGRVGSLAIIVWGLYPLGSLVSGFISETFGVSTATLGSSISIILVLILISFVFSELWNYRLPSD